MRRSAVALAALLALALACSHARTKVTRTAEEDYAAAMSEMKDKNWLEAQRRFEAIRNRYPYSKYAPLSELRLADIKFEQDRWIEAADAYKQFQKMHPTSDQADYAAFRVGVAHWRNAPGDFILFPPSFEKDLGEVRAAAVVLEDFLKSYPDSKHAAEGKKLLDEARRKLAEHEWYVAQFYRKRDRWAGVAGRLEGLVRDYPGSPYESQALLELAQAYLKMNERFRAQQALQQLIVKHPQDPRRAEAEKLLASIR